MLYTSLYGYEFIINETHSETTDTIDVRMIDKNGYYLKVGRIELNFNGDAIDTVNYILDCEPLELYSKIETDEYNTLTTMVVKLVRKFMPNFDAEKVAQHGYKFYQFNKHDVLEQHAKFDFNDSAKVLYSTDEYAMIKFEKSTDNWEYVVCGHNYESFFWGHYFSADDLNAHDDALSDYFERAGL